MRDGAQVFLLTEILKDAPISSDVLLSLVTQSNIEPRWEEIPLPPGR